ARLGMAVADHQTPPGPVTLTGELGHITVDLGLEGAGHHPPGAVEDNLIERRTHLRAGPTIGHYCQHRRSFLAGASTPAFSFWFNEEGTSRPQTGDRSTGSGHTSRHPPACLCTGRRRGRSDVPRWDPGANRRPPRAVRGT